MNSDLTMGTDRKWIIVRIDGKIAAISTDYAKLAAIAARLAQQQKPVVYDSICADSATLEEIWNLRKELLWDDLLLFGTDFQKKVWRKLWELTHDETKDDFAADGIRLLSYTDFADLCENRAGVRAVAHAIALNPVPVIIPCHLVVPKEAIDRIHDIHQKAQSTIFKGNDLSLENILKDPGIDFGEYALGKKLKRQFIQRELK